MQASATLLKKRLWYNCFPVNFVKYLRITFIIKHFWWLLLILWSLFNLNLKQTSEILKLVAVMMRKGESKTDNSMVTVSGASAVQKQSLEDVLQNRCQPCNFIKKRLQHRCFPMKFTKSLRTPFFTEHLYSDGCFWQ